MNITVRKLDSTAADFQQQLTKLLAFEAETDDADLGLWCAPRHVNFKRKGELIGAFSYEEILPRLKQELDALVASRKAA